ncbi:Nitrous oxide reductase maturation transmembrane protein NosY [hydrothermal vent metagenome]|uniref:Nitrous oxide reductase maturation transmembrane protein NosY n=1 Tax=hydrothermal vent metagenome TaxID=652676 RepID=A0A3B1C845_9ZZZZ
MNKILVVAEKEFKDGLRNRWVAGITVVLALFAMAISYFGAAASGMVGFTSLSTTIVSLSSLAIFLIPLIALILAYDSIVGEEEQGTLILLMTYPLKRSELLAGKFAGHAAILALSTLLGFGAAGLLIAVFSEQVGLGELLIAYSMFIATSILLGWVFIALAYLVSVMSQEKSRASGVALLIWFAFVFVFDLLLLGLLVGTGGSIGDDLFGWLLLLNPTDIFRLINLGGFEATQIQSGLASIADKQMIQPLVLWSSLLAWIVIPCLIAVWRFNKRVI